MKQDQADITPKTKAETYGDSYHKANAYRNLTQKYFPILSQLEDVQIYRTNKAEVLSAAQCMVLKYALSPEKLSKATFLQLCQGFQILNQAERLDQNLSSENISIKIGTMAISEGPP